ncbi:MAG: amidohydrolase [Sphingomonas sp.]|nr:amidohydrolase [Sphingomonas sp.]RZV51384.1 MAG: amidohydrolase [Sphingomonadaceae bacterium]
MTRLLIAASALALAAPAHADTLYTNVNGLQADAEGNLTRFAALHVDDDGKIIATIEEGRVLPHADIAVNMEGAHVLPGLIDAHGHVMSLGMAALRLDLVGTTSIEEFQQRLAEYAAANPDLPWILGRGWNQELFDDPRFPTAADLDAVVSDRPVWLGRIDGHAAVGNSKAMEIAGITAQTQAPEGGAIERLADGSPAGVFVDAAEGLVTKFIPEPDAPMFDRALAAAQQFALSEGLTGVADMGTTVDDWLAMRRAGDAGTLNLRIMSYAAGTAPALKIAGNRPTPWLYDGKLRMAGVKLYADGALGSRGAYLKAPYHDADTQGLLFQSTEDLLAQARTVSPYFQLAVHAIGDGANDQVLDVLETLGGDERRWRIEHVQILDPADLPRLAAANVVASMQPVHQTSDWKMAEKRLGPDRLGAAYAWKSLDDSGAVLAFGSDFPVEHPNPFVGLKVAVSREDADGEPDGGWIADEKVSLGTALAGFTVGAAYAGLAEQHFGSLTAGRYADFIVVDRDISAIPPEAIADTKVLATYVGGKEVFRAED